MFVLLREYNQPQHDSLETVVVGHVSDKERLEEVMKDALQYYNDYLQLPFVDKWLSDEESYLPRYYNLTNEIVYYFQRSVEL
jgi:hypothetical protein